MNTPVQKLRDKIRSSLPEGSVIAAHTQKEHFYHVPSLNLTFPSATAKLQRLKEEGLAEWKKNRALEYVFEHFKKFNDGNIMDQLAQAAKRDGDIFTDAGDIGRQIHQYREDYFNAWVATGKQPASTTPFIAEDMGIRDNRAVSAMGGLEKFCKDTGFIPAMSELMLYYWNPKTKIGVGGTLDDLGFMPRLVRKGREGCHHDMLNGRCVMCDLKYEYDLTLIDVKTSNQLKDTYWLQVAMYALMLYQRTGIRPKRYMILQLDKAKRDYKVEEIKGMPYLKKIVKNLFTLDEGIAFIKENRKPARFKLEL